VTRKPVLSGRLLRVLLKKSNAMRLSQLEALAPGSAGRVVFFGDTLAHDGLWNEWFPDVPTMNNGIVATGVQDMLDRLDRTIVAPRAVVVMAGNGDLAGMGRSRDAGSIAAQVGLLIGRLRTRFPAAAILITSAHPDVRRRRGTAVQQLNALLNSLARDNGATYIDIFQPLAGPGGVLHPRFTGRGLNGAGYRVLAAALAPHLRALSEASS
jgi:lysophospholipase L1-like esterase